MTVATYGAFLMVVSIHSIHMSVTLVAEKQMSLVYEKSVRVFLDLLLGWLNPHLQMQKLCLGILVCL
jgi:hypothetical protein